MQKNIPQEMHVYRLIDYLDRKKKIGIEYNYSTGRRIQKKGIFISN